MSDYLASTRSNYFRVKDRAAFEAWCTARGIESWNTSDGDEIRFAITADSNEGSGWPIADPETGEDLDLLAELSHHLVSTDVAILFEVGAEKLRYLSGHAVAVRAGGLSVRLSLEDIYPLAEQQFGPGFTITEGVY